jgi:hypothetical protein
MLVILGLPWSRRVARFGIGADGGSDCAAKGAPEDGALAATDFIAYGCAGGSAESSAYRCIHSGIPGVRGSAKQRGG